VLSIQLLGSPHLVRDSQPLSLTRRKSRALVYYIAAHTHPLTRDHLLAAFWPDTERAGAQQILRTTLHGLRKVLGPALIVEDVTLALAPDTDVDVRIFESRLSGVPAPTFDLQSLTSTLSLYRGDFLDGFTLPDTPTFDDWAATQRDHYRRLMVRGLIALSVYHDGEQNYTAALEALDHALAFDSLQEDLQRNALRLQYLAGDRAGAIRRYEGLRKLLDEEMGVPPMAETRAVYDAIINDRLEIPSSKIQDPMAAPKRSSPNLQPRISVSNPPLPFAGRASELNSLRALTHSGKLALLEGEPGLGKTRLAEEFIREATAIPLLGTARELEQSLPYQPMIEALRSLLARTDWPALRAVLQVNLPAIWLTEAARLLPELSPESAVHPRPRQATISHPQLNDESLLWEAVHQVLLVLARQHTVILFLDDLHWADASTLALLGYLAREGPDESGAHLLFLGAARPFPPRSPLAALVQTLTRENRVARLPLARLTRDEISALTQQICPAPVEPLTNWLITYSEGNPYILAELVRYAREHDILRQDGTLNLSASPIVPQSIYTLIQSRLARLSDSARRLLDAAVAIGREFEFEIAARAAALSESAALDALDELRAAGLIDPSPDDPLGRLYEFDHTLTMEVAYREVGELRHRLLHRRVAEAMEAVYRNKLDSVAGLLASHFGEGNTPERAAPYAFRAGQRAANLGAWTEALAFYKQALEGESAEARRQEIYLALGNAHMQAGTSAQASEALRSAAAIARERGDLAGAEMAQLGLGQSLLNQARYSEAIELAQSLLHGTNAASAEALWGTALSLEGADLAGAADHLQIAAALFRDESGPVDSARLAQVIFELGSVTAQQGDLPRAVALYRDALALAESSDAPHASPLRILAHNNLAYHLHLLNDPAALDHAQRGLRLAQEKGALGMQLFLLSTLGEIALAGGEVETAEKYFADGLALAERLDNPERIAGLTANLGRVAARRGETALAIHRFSTALARADVLGVRHLAAQIRLWLIPLLPPDEARAMLAETRVIAESGGRRRLLEEVKRLENDLPTG